MPEDEDEVETSLYLVYLLVRRLVAHLSGDVGDPVDVDGMRSRLLHSPEAMQRADDDDDECEPCLSPVMGTRATQSHHRRCCRMSHCSEVCPCWCRYVHRDRSLVSVI